MKTLMTEASTATLWLQSDQQPPPFWIQGQIITLKGQLWSWGKCSMVKNTYTALAEDAS